MKQSYLILAITALLFMGCDKAKELTEFTFDFSETVTIPGTTGLDIPINIPTPEIPTNASSTFESNNTSANLIEEINLTQFDLSLLSPTDGDLGFLKSIEVFMNAEGLSEQRIAWDEDVASDVGQTLALETTDTDLQDYIKSDAISFRVLTVTDELITTNHEIEIFSSFLVDAKILGQ